MRTIWKTTDSGDGYDRARLDNVFNMERPAHFPRAVVTATCTEDVIGAVRMALDQPRKCRVAVRSGGHSFFVWSLHDDSMLVDLGSWKEIVVDADTGIAEVTPGVTGAELNEYLRAHHGCFFPTGHCPDVALGGFLLHGGQGWNCRGWGYACDKVVGVEVVTAQAELLQCNEDENTDLFWAARGAGPLFPGIVTKFYLQLLPDLTGHIRSSAYIYPASIYHEAFEWVQSIVPDADRDTEIVIVAFHSDVLGETCLKIHFVAMKSNPLESEYALTEIHRSRPAGTITESVSQKDTMKHLYEDQIHANPKDHYCYTDDYFISNSANVTEVLEETCLTIPAGKSFAFWYPLYPRSRHTVSDMALNVPSDHYFVVYAIGSDRDEAARSKAWAQESMAKVKEHAVGSYLGECDLKMAYDWYWGRSAQRLATVRHSRDPDSLFCTVHEGSDRDEE
ncbi:FAD-binding domain-containing protein [Aspergillus steynii IBT 23096]|uniref:FAD-binding domain-containing protein n=1 Tax=Aspergillus steynii IBT 23096 TaxID=1392250 RepID=A0A2I2G138_9EURO|nr:FAD-binding domain-containing protein [Aspergillus steynii IBT 23096]PLB46578.1 FAD-binding domain-containing protein [Aspergillus steynii IBT 23096]